MIEVPYFRPSLGDAERAAVDRVMASGWLTTGQVVRNFERAFAEYVGARHAVALNSCTAALHLALEAAGVGPGDAVLVPTMTFAATAAAVRYLGARPALVDCDPTTLCMDVRDAERVAERESRQSGIRAAVAVHYGGQPADIDRLKRVAQRHGATLIEDAAHALPAYLRDPLDGAWRPIGSVSEITCFSFYANKCITTGEGGMAVTESEELAERMRTASLHGLSRNAWKRFTARGSWYYEIERLGYKYNMTDIAAAIGLAQLKKADSLLAKRRAIAQAYGERLSELAEFIELPVELEDRRSSWHLYPIRLRLEALSIGRAEFAARLSERGVGCSVHWMPLHLHPDYRRTFRTTAADCPTATREWERLVSLPIFPAMQEVELNHVCETVADLCVENAAPRAAAAFG